MRIKHVYAKHVMGIDEIDLNLEGHCLYLVGGRNGQGKSSALNAIAMALCGKRGCDYPSDAMKHGERTAVVRIDIEGAPEEWCNDEVRVERRMERRSDGTVKETLVITSVDGEVAPEPQTLLNRLYQHRGFDPLAFSRMKTAEQINELRKIVDIDLESFDEERAEVYEERTAIGREVKTLRGKLDGMRTIPDVPTEIVSVSELTEELARRSEINRVNERKRAQLEAHRGEYRSAMERSDRAKERVMELRRQLEEASREAAEAVNEMERLAEAGKELKEVVEALVDEDVQDVTDRIYQAEAVNEAVRHNKAKRELRAELDAKEDEYRALSSRIDDIDAAKARAIREANWPVEGLSFDGTMIRYKDVPFSQCSASERIRVSVAMGIAANPKLPLLIVANGECLDNEALREIEQMASERGYQILVEFMTRAESDEQRCQVIIEEGRSRMPVA